MNKPVRTRRSRRTTEEIVERIFEAAREEFEEHGYSGATTASIAKRAGVSEPLIFNHFESKARLFRETIFKPLERHFLEFDAAHRGDQANLDEDSRQYILELEGFMKRHSRMLATLAVAQLYENRNMRGMAPVEGLENFFSSTSAAVMERLSQEPRTDINLLGRISFATVLSCAVFKDWLFPEDLVSEEDISATLCDFIMKGFYANADG